LGREMDVLHVFVWTCMETQMKNTDEGF
jgi:hypothetical protein